MKKTLKILSCLFLLVPLVNAQDSLQVRKLSELYTYANYESIRDIGSQNGCIVNETGYVYLNRNLNNSPIWFPDTVYSCKYNYFAVDDSGIVKVENNVIQERWITLGKCYDVSPDDGWLYAATSRGFEKTYNQPWLLRFFEIPGGCRWITRNQFHIFLVANNEYVYSLDAANEQDMVVMDSIYIGYVAEDMCRVNNLLFIALGDSGWTTIDISNSYHLQEHIPPNNDISAYDIEINRDDLWICSEENGLHHFDIENLHDIQYVEYIPINSNDFCLNPNRGKIGTVCENNTIEIFNWITPDSVFFVDRFGQSKILDFFVFPSEYFLYQGIVLDQLSGMRRIGMDEPRDSFDFPGFPNTYGRLIDGEDSLFAVQTFDHNISIFRYDYYSYGEELAIAWTIPLDEELNDLDIKYDCLYTLSDESGLCIYELTVTEPPHLVFQDESITGSGMDLAPLFLGVVDEEYGLKTYSYEELEIGVIDEGSIQLNSIPTDLILYDNFAFVSCGEDGFKIVDCYDVENPQIASETDTDGFTHDITIGGGYFYIADGPEGVLVYDIHNPYEPELVGYYDTPGNSTGVDAWHENCGVADSSGVYILRYAYATDAPEIKTTAPSDFIIEKIYPNPFNPDCHVRISIPQSGLLELKVFNILGEEVSSLSKTRVKAGTFDYQFFGNNFASGIYFLQVELEGHGIQNSKMVLMK